MCRHDLFNRLELQQNHLFNNEICPKSLFKLDSLVENRNGDLSLHFQSCLIQLPAQHDFLDGFQESRSELPMNRNGSFNYFGANLIFPHFNTLCVSAPLREFFLLSLFHSFILSIHGNSKDRSISPSGA